MLSPQNAHVARVERRHLTLFVNAVPSGASGDLPDLGRRQQALRTPSYFSIVAKIRRRIGRLSPRPIASVATRTSARRCENVRPRAAGRRRKRAVDRRRRAAVRPIRPCNSTTALRENATTASPRRSSDSGTAVDDAQRIFPLESPYARASRPDVRRAAARRARPSSEPHRMTRFARTPRSRASRPSRAARREHLRFVDDGDVERAGEIDHLDGRTHVRARRGR